MDQKDCGKKVIYDRWVNYDLFIWLSMNAMKIFLNLLLLKIRMMCDSALNIGNMAQRLLYQIV